MGPYWCAWGATIGSQPPPTPAAPHIAPLPEDFELDPPVTSQLHQPASARGQAPKRPAPETPASPVFEGLPSGPLFPAPPSQFSTHSSDPPLSPTGECLLCEHSMKGVRESWNAQLHFVVAKLVAHELD